MSEWPPRSEKSNPIQFAASSLLGVEGNVFDRADCPLCDRTNLRPEDFRDELSRKEFGLSRMCQDCQDEVFGGDDE
jgi:hypothetical protein